MENTNILRQLIGPCHVPEFQRGASAFICSKLYIIVNSNDVSHHANSQRIN